MGHPGVTEPPVVEPQEARSSKLIQIREPTEEEMRRSSQEWYARVSWSFIDRWPPEVAALSIPTTFVRVDAKRLARFWGHTPDYAVAQETADLLDVEMGWHLRFVRLNSRSPKDVFPASDPFTCSGKQAVHWIMCSERCLDDIVLFSHIDEPLFICLREPRHMHKDGEFRCFAKDGEVIGVSRYFYDEKPEGSLPSKDALMKGASDFFRDHLSRHYRDVVFDLYAPSDDQGFLIEINPYGLSDPCCFGSYAELEATPGVRLEKEHHSVADDGALTGNRGPETGRGCARETARPPTNDGVGRDPTSTTDASQASGMNHD